MELLDLVARARRPVGFYVGLEEGREEGGIRDGQLCGGHASLRSRVVAPLAAREGEGGCGRDHQ